MTSSLRNALTSAAGCVLLAVAACSTGSDNPPQTGPSGDNAEPTTGSTSGSPGGSGSITTGSTSGTTPPASGATASGSSGSIASGSSGSIASGTGTSGTTPTTGSSTGASGSASGASTGAATGASTGASGNASGAASGSTAASLSFATDVYNNLGLCTACLPCHAPPNGGGYMTGKLDLSTSDNAYTALVGVKAAGASCGTSGLTRVVAGSYATSLFYNKLNAKTTGGKAPCGNPMPASGAALSAANMMVIQNWIAGGAKP